MIRGLYTAASGMLVQFLHQSVLSTNLANVNSVGFKEDVMPTRESTEVGVPPDFNTVLASLQTPAGAPAGTIGLVGGGVLTDPVIPDLSEGKLENTGRDQDFALQGPGFFSVQATNGETWYTRAGNFTRQTDGSLISSDGLRVMGQNGPISLPSQGRLDVDSAGDVYVDGQFIDKLAVVDVPANALLEQVGQNSFRATNPNATVQPSTSSVVEQGFLESSNVDLNQTMVNMMSASQTYSTNSRMLQMQDETLQKAVTDLGRLA